jgi:hypothetical protein
MEDTTLEQLIVAKDAARLDGVLMPDELDPQLVAVIAAYIYPSCTNEQREEWTADLLRLGDSPAQELYVQLAALKAEILAEAQAREAALLAQARKEERERCYQAVAVEVEVGEEWFDYNAGITDALQAIRDLESEQA